MCPGVESDKPGSCPKCGMALERATPAAASSKTIYTCPMHPEIEQDEPGDCPICGMRLEPKTVTLDNEEDDSELNDMSRRFWIGIVSDRSAVRHDDGRNGWHSIVEMDLAHRLGLGSTDPGNAGCTVGRLAVLPTWLAFDHQSQPQHVYLDLRLEPEPPTSTV